MYGKVLKALTSRNYYYGVPLYIFPFSEKIIGINKREMYCQISEAGGGGKIEITMSKVNGRIFCKH